MFSDMLKPLIVLAAGEREKQSTVPRVLGCLEAEMGSGAGVEMTKGMAGRARLRSVRVINLWPIESLFYSRKSIL